MTAQQIAIICFLTAFPLVAYARRITTLTVGNFAVYRRQFGWFPIAAGLSMTFVGGAATVNMASLGYQFGWYPIIDPLSVLAAILWWPFFSWPPFALLATGHPLIDALLAHLQNAPFSGDTAVLAADGAKPGIVEARYRVTWDRTDQGSTASVVRVSVNDQCYVDENGFDAERLESGQTAPTTSPLKLPMEAEARTEEAIRLWIASRRTEMPEGTIVRCDLLGISAAV